MDTTAVINILLHGNQLKRTPRTGWVQRGVPNAENVAAHSYGVVYATLVLSSLVNTEINWVRFIYLKTSRRLSLSKAEAANTATTSTGSVSACRRLKQMKHTQINLERALAMAVLHDLPEGLTTDIPTPAWRFLPPGIKTEVERSSMQEILGKTATSTGSVQATSTGSVTVSSQFMAWWEELHANKSAEALLVHDADKIDMFLQALVYEQQTGNQHLAEFWDKPYIFNYPEIQALYDELRASRLM